MSNGAHRGSISADPQTGKEYINLMSLPAELQPHLAKFDQNNDGFLAVDELAALARFQASQRKENSLLKKMFMLIFLLLILMVLISFGLSFAVWEMTRESKVEGDTIQTMEGHVVQVDSHETQLSAQTLVNRQTGAPIKTADSNVHIDVDDQVSSALPNEFWQEFKAFSIKDPLNNFLELKVNGFARRMNGHTDYYNSTIVLFTEEGKLFLTGTQWETDEAVASVIRDTGFDFGAEENEVAGRHLMFFINTGNAEINGGVNGFIAGFMVGTVGCLVTGPMWLGCAMAVTAASTAAGVEIGGNVQDEREYQLSNYERHPDRFGHCSSGFYSKGAVYTTSGKIDVLSTWDCAAICMSEPQCTAFSWSGGLRTCARYTGTCSQLHHVYHDTHRDAYRTFVKNSGLALSGYSATGPGCVNGNNIRKYSDKTEEQCAQLCRDYGSGCKGFEYGVAYGGGGSYLAKDCQLSSSANTAGCDGRYYNLAFYTKL